MTRVAIVDYGLGNLYNVQRALSAVGADAVVTSAPSELRAAAGLVLPGVGAFGEGIGNLRARGLVRPLIEAAAAGTPVLGICLGMQLLFDSSEEFGQWEGLGLIPGRVVRFDHAAGNARFKVPQIGWNTLQRGERASDWSGTILDRLHDGTFVYFVHSYHAQTAVPENALAETQYGQNRFCSVARRVNVMGCQFHPEKSGEAGLRILANFIRQL